MKPWHIYVAATMAFVALVLSKFDRETGFSELAGFGANWQERQLPEIKTLAPHVKENSGGYDGQFYAQLAIDPTLRHPGLVEAIDSPAYRARRIALPALAHVLGFGRPGIVLQIYCLLNLACWFLLGWLLLRWMPPVNWGNAARWLVCMFSMGVLESVRFALVDLPALTLMVAAMQWLEKQRRLLSWAAAGLAVFTKETAVLNLVHYFTPAELRRPQGAGRALAGTGAIAFLFGAWFLYLNQRFAGPGLHAAVNFSLPGVELVRALIDAGRHLLAGDFDTRYSFRIIAALGLLAQALHLAFHPEPRDARWRMGIVYGLLFICLGEAVWSGYWAACRIALPVTIAFAVLLRDDRRFWPAIILTNLTVLHAIGRWL